mgnify:CR=1 FL=1
MWYVWIIVGLVAYILGVLLSVWFRRIFSWENGSKDEKSRKEAERGRS